VVKRVAALLSVFLFPAISAPVLLLVTGELPLLCRCENTCACPTHQHGTQGVPPTCHGIPGTFMSACESQHTPVTAMPTIVAVLPASPSLAEPSHETQPVPVSNVWLQAADLSFEPPPPWSERL
jgi:hypothetical protein